MIGANNAPSGYWRWRLNSSALGDRAGQHHAVGRLDDAALGAERRGKRAGVVRVVLQSLSASTHLQARERGEQEAEATPEDEPEAFGCVRSSRASLPRRIALVERGRRELMRSSNATRIQLAMIDEPP